MGWVGHVLGLDNASGPWYLWWSGACGDVALLGAAYSIIRRHNCHTPHCWRVGRHPVMQDGVMYLVCARHHPDDDPGFTPTETPDTPAAPTNISGWRSGKGQ